MKKQLIRQFGHPKGPLGAVAGRVMATRTSNVTRNRWTAALLDPAPDANLLEIGHGPGIAISEIWPVLETGKVVGVDVSALMHRTAARRNREGIACGRVELTVGDAQQLPEHLAGFDVIYGINVSMFWSDTVATVGHLTSRLAPGGELVLVHMPPPTADVTSLAVADELARSFESVGLAGVHQQVMDSDPPAVATRGRAPTVVGAAASGGQRPPTTSTEVSPNR